MTQPSAQESAPQNAPQSAPQPVEDRQPEAGLARASPGAPASERESRPEIRRESRRDSIQGVACPNCGGMVPIPEGQLIVRCPYCDLRSLVRGDRGIQRYQVPTRLDRQQAQGALRGFLQSSPAIAREAAGKAQLNEVFLAYLPFWATWARVLGWVFGQKQVGSGDHKRYEPREVRITEEMSWNGVACDVGEFGVDSLPLTEQPLEPFNAEALHAAGLVFEPVSSLSDAREASDQEFTARVEDGARLDRVAQVFTRKVRERMGLVYYPLWIIRYLYRGRAFQVVIDGFSGKVLYGKAPGSTLYRAAILVGGMALGALIAVDVASGALYLASQSDGDNSSGMFFAALALVGVGGGMMLAAYRKFRYGEHYEYRGHRRRARRGEKSLPESLFEMVRKGL